MKLGVLLLIVCVFVWVQGASIESEKVHTFADTVYHNGNIITMDDKRHYGMFVATKNGKILKVS